MEFNVNPIIFISRVYVIGKCKNVYINTLPGLCKPWDGSQGPTKELVHVLRNPSFCSCRCDESTSKFAASFWSTFTLFKQKAASILLNQGTKSKENEFDLTFCQVEGLGQVHEDETGTMISDANFPVQFSNNIYTHKKTWKQFIKEVKQLGIYFTVKVIQSTF